MDSDLKHVILPIAIENRHFRIHLGGSKEQLAAVIPQIRILMTSATKEEDFLSSLAELLDGSDVILADILDMAEPRTLGAMDTFTVLKAIAKSSTASKAWLRLKVLLETSDEDALNALVIPTDHLLYTRMYIESVLRDLDENSETAMAELRGLLPEVYAYLLLD